MLPPSAPPRCEGIVNVDDDAPEEEELIDPEDLESLGGIETDDPDILEVDELDEPDFDEFVGPLRNDGP